MVAILKSAIDTERFRLRRFVDQLIERGECEVRREPIELIEIGTVLDGNPRAVLFKAAGPERAELVGNVMGSRQRLAGAIGTDERGLLPALNRRLTTLHPPVTISSPDAPVQQVVKTGDAADLCALPVHLQHGADGAPYISAGLDFARFPGTGFSNVGCRRLMLRGPQQAGIDLVAPSDLRALYLAAAARGEKLPLAFAVGAHPADFLGAMMVLPGVDELAILGAMRGAPVPVVKCVTSDLLVPADAEYVIEGYLDPAGPAEPEGPYGEYVGYYGVLKRNPVFHVTAITHREDALFQTLTIGGRHLALTDTTQLTATKTETAAWAALATAVREPVAIHATASSGGMLNMRVALRQRVPGDARNAIAAVMGSQAEAKHVFAFDPDIDVFSDQETDWALATRFQADRDLVLGPGFRVVPIDPSLGGARTGAKLGFDCTIPFGQADSMAFAIPAPPEPQPSKPQRSVADALAAGPASFLELMAAAGSTDGRDVVRALDRLDAAQRLGRLDDGRYRLKDAGP